MPLFACNAEIQPPSDQMPDVVSERISTNQSHVYLTLRTTVSTNPDHRFQSRTALKGLNRAVMFHQITGKNMGPIIFRDKIQGLGVDRM